MVEHLEMQFIPIFDWSIQSIQRLSPLPLYFRRSDHETASRKISCLSNACDAVMKAASLPIPSAVPRIAFRLVMLLVSARRCRWFSWRTQSSMTCDRDCRRAPHGQDLGGGFVDSYVSIVAAVCQPHPPLSPQPHPKNLTKSALFPSLPFIAHHNTLSRCAHIIQSIKPSHKAHIKECGRIRQSPILLLKHVFIYTRSGRLV